ncbi:phosphomevalonate kinase [Synchytrium endobioticum]|uniref:Phosphomevalonate kinase n=1 Tax=Synchytrium endobioticum TaxID=286115 RepID=A0A507CND3_9FUNG|nr:phosphomevalonate kinase [Synchytrium endobioticum]TPX40634.1 phosphomevalonate kinase [Synchytrium endobioticum]
MKSTDSTITVSAPGKVLVTGGYLVLDRQYSGLVIATSSRFYCTIKPLASPSSIPNESKLTGSTTTSHPCPRNMIIVNSPQFLDGHWEYQVQDNCLLKPTCVDQKSNNYLEITIQYALAACSMLSTYKTIIHNGLDVTIQGHNDFYSQREELKRKGLPLNYSSLKQLPPFSPTHTTLSEVHKTGLGSSAAMIASLTGALLVYFEAASLPSTTQSTSESNSSSNSLRLIHNLAQLSHCLAQGKVGSGFDVSAAVRGSHSYKRFSPSIIEPLMSLHSSASQRDYALLIRTINPFLGGEWDDECIPFELPKGFSMMLADIDAGSSTPKLVSQVLAWRNAKPDEANALWNELHTSNQKVEKGLHHLVQLQEDDGKAFESAIATCCRLAGSEWEKLAMKSESAESTVITALCNVYATFQSVRKCLRDMSQRAGVPIEPPEQTRLLDVCQSQPGVLMAGIPGAGGYDAIFVILVSDGARNGVETVWAATTVMNVGPLLATASDGCMKVES